MSGKAFGWCVTMWVAAALSVSAQSLHDEVIASGEFGTVHQKLVINGYEYVASTFKYGNPPRYSSTLIAFSDAAASSVIHSSRRFSNTFVVRVERHGGREDVYAIGVGKTFLLGKDGKLYEILDRSRYDFDQAEAFVSACEATSMLVPVNPIPVANTVPARPLGVAGVRPLAVPAAPRAVRQGFVPAGDFDVSGRAVPVRAPAPLVAGEELLHVVAAGETLSAIARSYGSSVASVIQRNALADPNSLQPGQRLVIPVRPDLVGR